MKGLLAKQYVHIFNAKNKIHFVVIKSKKLNIYQNCHEDTSCRKHLSEWKHLCKCFLTFNKVEKHFQS